MMPDGTIKIDKLRFIDTKRVSGSQRLFLRSLIKEFEAMSGKSIADYVRKTQVWKSIFSMDLLIMLEIELLLLLVTFFYICIQLSLKSLVFS